MDMQSLLHRKMLEGSHPGSSLETLVIKRNQRKAKNNAPSCTEKIEKIRKARVAVKVEVQVKKGNNKTTVLLMTAYRCWW